MVYIQNLKSCFLWIYFFSGLFMGGTKNTCKEEERLTRQAPATNSEQKKPSSAFESKRNKDATERPEKAFMHI